MAQMDVKQVKDEMKQMFGIVPNWVDQMPKEAIVGFWNVLRDTQLGETRIPNKYKELIGLAVSGATRCRYCAFFHTEAARLYGATDEEIAEASAMGGVTMFASTFMNAQQANYEQFVKETKQMIEFVKKQQQKQPAPRAQA